MPPIGRTTALKRGCRGEQPCPVRGVPWGWPSFQHAQGNAMGSMILATSPKRRIIDASPDLADWAGSPQRSMVGLDCASIVRCRNAEGVPLCHNFCPALMAARSKLGAVEQVPIWLEDPRGDLRPFDATFQRLPGLRDGMVVAFFGDSTGEEANTARESAPSREPVPRRRHRAVSAGRRARLKLVSG